MDRIRLIASDMDATLLDEHSQLPPDFEQVIRALAQQGILFAAASGTDLDRDAATQENMEVSAVMEPGAPVENAADQVRQTFSPNA